MIISADELLSDEQDSFFVHKLFFFGLMRWVGKLGAFFVRSMRGWEAAKKEQKRKTKNRKKKKGQKKKKEK